MVKYLNQWIWPSNTTSATYIISLTYDGEYQCSCYGWTRHVPRRDCTHIRDLKATPEALRKGLRFVEVRA